MDAIYLAHESLTAVRVTANLGLDFCSYVREISLTCLVVLIWHYLLVKTLVLSTSLWREGKGGKLTEVLNSFLNIAIIISIA